MPKTAEGNGGRADPDQDSTSGLAVWGQDFAMALLRVNCNSKLSTDNFTPQTLWAELILCLDH